MLLRILCFGLLGGLTAAPLSAAEMVNGDFEAGLSGWSVLGDVNVPVTPGNDVAFFSEAAAAPESRITQVFDLPDSPDTLSFRFTFDSRAAGGPQFAVSPRGPQANTASSSTASPWGWVGNIFPPSPEPGADLSPLAYAYSWFILASQPPDSFTVFLLDPDTRARLLPPPDEPPVAFADFFYVDSTGLTMFNNQYVSLVGPDGDGVFTVTLDLASLPSARSVALEFGLAGFPNQTITTAAVDNIIITAIPDGPVARCAQALPLADPAPDCCTLVTVADLDAGSEAPAGFEALCITAVDGQPVDGGCVSAVELCGPGKNFLVELTITDVLGRSDACTTLVTLADTTPPVLECPPPVTRACESPEGVPTNAVDLTPPVLPFDPCRPDAAITLLSDAPADFFPIGDTVVTLTATDPAGNFTTCTTTVTVTDECVAPELLIDISPGRDDNLILLKRNYTIYVAVLTTPAFDPADLDPDSLRFGPTGVEAAPLRVPFPVDLNADGLPELLLGFATFDCGFGLGDTLGILTGVLVDGTPVAAADAVTVQFD